MHSAKMVTASLRMGVALAAGLVGRTQAAPAAIGTASESVDLNAHIRPILNQNCTACHGGVKTAGGISFIYLGFFSTTGDADFQREHPTLRVPNECAVRELPPRRTTGDAAVRAR